MILLTTLVRTEELSSEILKHGEKRAKIWVPENGRILGAGGGGIGRETAEDPAEGEETHRRDREMEALEAPEEEVMEEEVMNRKPMCGRRILLPGMKRERTVSKERRKVQRVLMLGFCRVATASGAFLERPATPEWTV